jgi:EmrB/QacA subfamily drug resistance transporter
MTSAFSGGFANEQARPRAVGWVLSGLSLSMLLSSLGTSIANVALPTLANAFEMPFGHVQWIVLAYLLTITTFIVSVGKLGDIIGRRKLLLAGLLVFTIASALCGLSPWFWFLVAVRAAQGLGAAVMMALTMAFVGDTVPRERTGSAMGLLGTMSAVGTALGPALGGVLIAGFGWQAVFLLNVPLGIAAFGLAWRFLPADHRTAESGRVRFDVPGTLLLAGTLAAYALAMTMGRGDFGRLSAMLLATALLGVALFVIAETRIASPLIRPAAFRDAGFSAGLASNMLVSTVMMATLVVGPFYLSRALGLTEALVGLVMSAGPVTSALSGVVAGRVVDRFGAAPMAIAGLAAMAAGAMGLAILPAISGIAGYVAAVLMLTPGYQLFQAANNTAVMKDAPADQRGVMAGMLNLSRNLGLVTGASAMGAIFAAGSGATDIATAPGQAVATGMAVTFAVASILILIGIGLVVAGSMFAGRKACAEPKP